MAVKHDIWRGVAGLARQIGVLFASLLAAAALLVFSAVARSEPVAVDRSPSGAPYVAGELIVTFEEAAPDRAVESLDEEAKVEQDLPALDARLLAFPEVKRDPSQGSRERALARIKEDLARDLTVESVEYNYIGRLAYTPDDPKFKYQWGLKKPGFREAWSRTRGAGVHVAVVDTGVAVGHVDLRQKIAQARDIVNDDGTVRDISGHGTHVAGIIAADTDNHKGVAAGCPKCKLLIAKVFDGKNTGTVARFAEAIRWSADHGADVINLSFEHPARSPVEEGAIDYARNKGAVVVAAAGNGNTSDPTFPAASPGVIAVAATNSDDLRASFSNHGSWIDVAAPGVKILSTIPSGYASWSGTSMATPHVSALAALLASRGRGRANIETRITDTAVDLGPRGRDPYYGAGRISANRAVK